MARKVSPFLSIPGLSPCAILPSKKKNCVLLLSLITYLQPPTIFLFFYFRILSFSLLFLGEEKKSTLVAEYADAIYVSRLNIFSGFVESESLIDRRKKNLNSKHVELREVFSIPPECREADVDLGFKWLFIYDNFKGFLFLFRSRKKKKKFADGTCHHFE